MKDAGTTRLPDVLLERLALGELPPDAEADVRARLEGDPDAQARLEALARSDAEILEAHPAAVLAAQIRARAATAGETRRPAPLLRPLLVGLPLAAAAALALVVLLPGTTAPELEDGLRAKGGPELVVHRRSRAGAERLEHGAQAGPGDLLQLGYVAAGAPHGVILSVDGRGQATLHHPPAPGAPTDLTGGGLHNLPRAYELDDAPAFERFFLVTAPAPIDVDALLRAAQALHGAATQPLPVPADQDVRELTLTKP